MYSVSIWNGKYYFNPKLLSEAFPKYIHKINKSVRGQKRMDMAVWRMALCGVVSGQVRKERPS